MQSPTGVYNCIYYHLVKKLQVKINQLNSHIKELEDNETNLKTTRKSIAPISIITKNQLVRAKSQIENLEKEYSLVSNKLEEITAQNMSFKSSKKQLEFQLVQQQLTLNTAVAEKKHLQNIIIENKYQQGSIEENEKDA